MAHTPRINPDRVRARRLIAGFSLDSLGTRTATSRTYLRLVERGEVTPDWPTVVALADALNVEVTDLVAVDV